jgi:hypothetical protein
VRRGTRTLIVAAVLIAPPVAFGEDKKDDKKKEPAPVVTCVNPLGLIAGTTKTLRIRGQNLGEASAVQVTVADGVEWPATLKSKGKSEAPKPFDAAKAGDTEVQAEVKVPPEAKAGEVAVVVVTPAGPTKSTALHVFESGAAVEEKEPNGGFKQAQEVPLGTTVLGAIQDSNDVDVFRIGGRAGERVVAEVTAERRGSLLDGTLTLYDAAGHVLATADDSAGSRDPILRATLPSDGVYYLSLNDAGDHGSTAHTYELVIRRDDGKH